MCYNNMYSILFFVLIAILALETTPFSITITIDTEQDETVKQAAKSINEVKNLSSASCGPYEIPDFSSVGVRISEQKCMEYVYQMLKREERYQLGCPEDVSIIHGKSTKPAEYPHMGALGWFVSYGEYDFMCGASLVSEKFMLTTAHCTMQASKKTVKPYPSIVRLGSRYLRSSPLEAPEDVEIRTLIIHHDYDAINHYYDIALIELKSEVKFSKYIQPACLSTREYNLYSKKRLTVTGWGQTAPRRNNYSNKLLYSEITIYPDDECNTYLERYGLMLKSHQMCAGDKKGEMDTCGGDSGGPLQYALINTTQEGTIHRILSITSFGLTDCATIDAPGIYTKVSNLIDWIECVVWGGENRRC